MPKEKTDPIEFWEDLSDEEKARAQENNVDMTLRVESDLLAVALILYWDIARSAVVKSLEELDTTYLKNPEFGGNISDAILNGIHKSVSVDDYSNYIYEDIKEAMVSSYVSGYSPFAAIGEIPLFTIPDKMSELAAKALGQHIPDHVLPRVEDAVRAYYQKMLRGQVGVHESKQKILDDLKHNILVNGFGAAESVVKVIVSQYTFLTRSLGSISGMAAIGALYYKWNALPGHCEVCGELDGTIIDIRRGIDTADRVLKSQDPAELKAVLPWIRHKSGINDMTLQNVVFPPIHPHCRCYITIES